jgi:hypothetical protein
MSEGGALGKAPPCHGARGHRTFAGSCTNGKVAPEAVVREMRTAVHQLHTGWVESCPPNRVPSV